MAGVFLGLLCDIMDVVSHWRKSVARQCLSRDGTSDSFGGHSRQASTTASSPDLDQVGTRLRAHATLSQTREFPYNRCSVQSKSCCVMSKNQSPGVSGPGDPEMLLIRFQSPGNIVGRVLTIIDALGLPAEQSKATKDLVRQAVWNELDDEILVGPRTAKAFIEQFQKVREAADKAKVPVPCVEII